MSDVNVNPESPFVCFTEFRKKKGDGEYAVLHVTIRDTNDQMGMTRVKNIIDLQVGDGWEHCDVPKKTGWSGGGGNKGGGKPQRVEIKADGRFEIRAMLKVHLNNKDNIKVLGVNGEDCIAWEGRSLKEFIAKQNHPAVTAAFGDWASWNLNEEHVVSFQTNNLFAQCTKSNSGAGHWYVKEFLIEPKA